MKATHKTQRFNYKKIEDKNNPRDYWEYFGIHSKSGRLHIDTKRFKKIMEQEGTTEFLHNGMFKNRTTTYLMPKKVHKYDYKINLIREPLLLLQKDWNEEFKPLFLQIKKPNEIYENTRLDSIAMTTFADDIDEIEVKSRLASFRRERRYRIITQSLYCQFICKICIEVDRLTLLFIKELGYSKKDFKVGNFSSFTDNLKGLKKANLISNLNGYNSYNLLHRINNFLKHNTSKAYNELKKEYPENVCSIENKTAKSCYENGMFAGDWIIINDGYIDMLFKELLDFFEDYCKIFLDEDLEESKWNYDDYFKYVYRKVRKTGSYFDLDN